MKPDEGDGIVDVRLCTEDDDIMLTTALGKSIRFKVTDIRRFVGRTSSGVRGIKLAGEDEVISMAELSEERLGELQAREQFILTLADDGMGKRSSSYDYRCMNRGGQGVTAQNLERKGGEDAKLVRSCTIGDDDQLMIVTDGGQLIRCPVRNIRIVSRSSRGVTVIRTKADERVVSVGRIEDDGEDDDEPNEEDAAPAPES